MTKFMKSVYEYAKRKAREQHKRFHKQCMKIVNERKVWKNYLKRI
jgi:hypothetical protein